MSAQTNQGPSVAKLTVVPIQGNPQLYSIAPIDLGHGFTIEAADSTLNKVDLTLWERVFSPEQIEDLRGWSLSLVHKYQAAVGFHEEDRDSLVVIGYILGHLRLIAPNQISASEHLQIEEYATGRFHALDCTKDQQRPSILLNDCERFFGDITQEHLSILRVWMPWIIDFAKRWREFYPLYLSLFFSEKGFSDLDFRTRHLFRVMALEALLSSESEFGRHTLKGRLQKFLGWRRNLYQPYSGLSFPMPGLTPLPELALTDSLVEDVYSLRNKVAHADAMPPEWTKTDRRQGFRGPLSYADVLCEAAGSMVRLAWLKIINEGLQPVFSDKKRVADYFRN
jgi:hypothetical protein